MEQRLLTFTILLLISSKSFCQFTDSDITITTKGLSEEYATRFKDGENKAALVSVLNQLYVTNNILPIKITVTYQDGEGDVTAEINYNHEKIFTNSDYERHNSEWSSWGKGISVYLQDQIFTALSKYKKAVATKGWTMDKDLLAFESSVKCKKANGDWVCFYARNYLNYQGFYPFNFYMNAHISIGGKLYETETSNTKTLNEMKFFMVGKTTGIDGSKTGAYYFCEFFNIEMK
jgi:hypothetical protein